MALVKNRYVLKVAVLGVFCVILVQVEDERENRGKLLALLDSFVMIKPIKTDL